MFGRELAKNLNKVIEDEEYICDTHLTQCQLYFSIKRKDGGSDDALLIRLCNHPNKFARLIDNLAREIVPDYMENSVIFKMNNGVLEGSLELRDNITSDFMFLYDEVIAIDY